MKINNHASHPYIRKHSFMLVNMSSKACPKPEEDRRRIRSISFVKKTDDEKKRVERSIPRIPVVPIYEEGQGRTIKVGKSKARVINKI